MRSVVYSKSAIKVLRRIPANDAKRILSKISQYADNPLSLSNNIKILTGSPYSRLRIGDWRIIMSDRNEVLQIHKIGPRGGIYN